MRQRSSVAVTVWASFLGLCICAQSTAEPYVAFSLNGAQRALHSAHSSSARALGGIAKPVAVVYDAENDDVILVGKPSAERSLSLDDFVVALRTVVERNEVPFVSIDWAPETDQTKQQRVCFGGPIANTAFGMDLLDADVVLKKLAFGEVSAGVWGVQSYFDMVVEKWRATGKETPVVTRFWFTPMKSESRIAVRDGVAVANDLKIAVRMEVMGAVTAQHSTNPAHLPADPPAEQFALLCTVNLAELSAAHPEIAKLDALFRLAGLAKGIQRWKDKHKIDLRTINYWLHDYSVKQKDTPEYYPVIQREAKQGTRTMLLEGGVDLRSLVLDIEDGSESAFKKLVIGTRPSGLPLTWEVPFLGELDSLSSGEANALQQELRRYPAFATSVRTIYFDGSTPPAGLRTYLPQPSPGMGALNRPSFSVTDSLAHRTPFGAIGGVMLSGAATLAGMGEGAARVDLTGGNFSLVVDGKNARIAPETYRKFITALWCVYYSDQDPGISIDPPPRDSDKEETEKEFMKGERHSVRYIGRVLNTDLGRVMREADYLMKKWAVGTQPTNYPGLLSVDGYQNGRDAEKTRISQRFWFVPENLGFKRGGDLLLFDTGSMRVNTEYTTKGMRGKTSPSAEAFADFFTRHYDDIAAKNSIYRELFEYAKLVSLATYLKQQGVPLHWFLLANKDLVLLEDSVREVDALVKRSDHVPGLMAKGGVDLAATPTCSDDANTAEAVGSVMARLPSVSVHATGLPGDSGVCRVPVQFSFDVGKQSYSVLPQHTLTSGKDHRGIRYQTDLALRQAGRPGLELVRYYNPGNREGGEFGQGWHLLIPYRVKPADDTTRKFLNVSIPQQMKLENLCTGSEEVLSFSEDRYATAGYVPDKSQPSQVVGLFLMSNASFRLTDKLGNQFHFATDGYLTDMCLSPDPNHRLHVEYVDGSTDAFEREPYVVRPVDKERIAFLNAMVPKQVKVTDLLHGQSEVLSFNGKNPIPAYLPDDEKTSRYRLLAVLSNAGLQLVDKHGTQTVFDPGWKFRRMLLSRDQRMVRSLAMGGQKVTFGYTINGTGEVIIASSSLSANAPDAPATHVVRYEHDDEGRLCRVRHSEAPAPQNQRKQDSDLAIAERRARY